MMDLDTIVFLVVLFLEGLGGAIGTWVVLEMQRKGFSAELRRLSEKWDHEREGYIDRIARLEGQVEYLMTHANLTVNAQGDVNAGNIAGQRVGG